MGLAEHPFFSEILLVLFIATIIAATFERLKLPATLGFLIAGVFIGPHALGFISDTERIYNLAELGVIFLLLTIGIEFPFDRIRGLGKIAAFGGGIQIIVSIAIGIFVSQLFGWSLYHGFVLGAVVALSSTAIVLKFLIDRGELETLHGKVAIAILVFQDLAFVPLLILVHTLGMPGQDLTSSLFIAAVRVILFSVVITVLWRFVLTRLLEWVVLTRNREVFLLTVIVICLGGAFLSAFFGLSMAIGAFVVGLMLANTPYGNQVAGEIVPFRHIFVNLFFVSLGLLFNPQFALANAGLILVVFGLVLVTNFVIMTLIIMFFGFPPRIALVTGLILAQIGEFSFLLLDQSRKTGLIEDSFFNILLSVAFLTIFATPFFFRAIPLLARLCDKIPLFGMSTKEAKKWEASPIAKGLKNHVIICGYGMVGRDLVIALQQEEVPHVVLELNPKEIKIAREDNANIIYGDATNEEVMKKAKIANARAVVVSFAEPFGMVHIVRVVQRLNPDTIIVVRSRYEKDVPNLYELGADLVVMEELEASLELNRAVLESFKIPPEKIQKHLQKIRTRKELAIEKAIFKRTTGISEEKD